MAESVPSNDAGSLGGAPPPAGTVAVGHVIVAAYNEADRIAATVDALHAAFPEASVLVADDGSTDDTAAVASAAGATVVSAGGKRRGKGQAASLAAERALFERREGHGGDAVLLADADLATSAAKLAPLAEAVTQGDAGVSVAVFAKRVGGGFGLAVGFAHWAIERRSGFDARAPISGQRALTYEALAAVTPFRDGFGMEIGMTVDAIRAGHAVTEVELDLAHRATGKSLRGFIHRGRQLKDFLKVYVATRRQRAA